MTPRGDLAVDCYVDADFAGLWGTEDPQDPVVSKSRTGYVIKLSGCPVIWFSKLQELTALSSMESEYIALSNSLRQVLYLRKVVEEMAENIGYKAQLELRTHSTVFEDNNGALALANSPHLTPRSRHFATRYHHFKSHVKDGTIKIIKIDTTLQEGDLMTKACPKIVFERLRKLLMGW